MAWPGLAHVAQVGVPVAVAGLLKVKTVQEAVLPVQEGAVPAGQPPVCAQT